MLIGVSVHSKNSARTARDEGADLVVYGPLFETPGKAAKGLDELSDICRSLEPFPVIGLGGVDIANCKEVVAAGAAGVAGIRSFVDTASLNAIIKELRA